MAFRFPSSNWQEPAGFQRSPSTAQCAVCGATYDIGFEEILGTHVCQRHSKMQRTAIVLVTLCRKTNRKITVMEFEAGRWNSYDRDVMIPYMCDALLLEHTRLTLDNCSRVDYPAHSYDQAIILYAKELANRLRKSIGE